MTGAWLKGVSFHFLAGGFENFAFACRQAFDAVCGDFFENRIHFILQKLVRGDIFVVRGGTPELICLRARGPDFPGTSPAPKQFPWRPVPMENLSPIKKPRHNS